MMTDYYVKLSKGFGNSKFVKEDDLYSKIYSKDADWYVSTCFYNAEQKEKVDSEFKTTGKFSVAGIHNLVTNKLWWDFDSDDLNKAKADAEELVQRLFRFGFEETDVQIYFSGGKGFHVIVKLDTTLTPKDVQNICHHVANGLECFDSTMYDAPQVLRVPFTQHEKTKLYKIPLTYQDMKDLTIDDIKNDAANIERYNVKEVLDYFTTAKLPTELEDFKNKVIEVKEVQKLELKTDIDFFKKPKGWTNCKWALCNGVGIKPGDRHHKLLAVIATCKALNYTPEQAYYWAKSADEKGVELNGGVKCSKSDMWRDVNSVYATNWKGGTFSCKDGKTLWLTELCNSLGSHKCKSVDLEIVSVNDVFDLFKDYAENFEKNVIKTGIDVLDEKCKFLVGNSNGILAPPGVGKTSFVTQILNNNSNQDIDSVFFSYDMFHSMVYMRLVQRHFGYQQDKIFDIFKNDKKQTAFINDTLKEQYKNVHFCFKSGQTADEIQDTIKDTEDKIGRKIKLGIVDYNELVISNVSDPTQASAQVAQRLRQIANDTSTCIITLLQPSKIFSNPSDEITTYQGAKGSGAIAQSLSLMLSLSRPGFSPRYPELDKFLTVNALKNRLGSLFTVDLAWDGLKGEISELTPEAAADLKALREQKASESEESDFG